jgi:cytochrome oxidase Cu insertion factor (SCO1/SenC/PrrC family)
MKLITPVFLAAIALLPSPLTAADRVSAGERRSTPAKTGDLAADFTLADQDGRNHTLSAERGKRAVVLIFYRGYW